MSFSKCLDFCVFVKFTNFKNLTSSKTLIRNGSYTYAYFFWIPSTIKLKSGEILVYLIGNISNMFLAACWRLETSSKPFYHFNFKGQERSPSSPNQLKVFIYLSIDQGWWFNKLWFKRYIQKCTLSHALTLIMT